MRKRQERKERQDPDPDYSNPDLASWRPGAFLSGIGLAMAGDLSSILRPGFQEYG
jgi:hypothetical protein